MAWVHGMSCIIYIRIESNILRADNLTQQIRKKEKVHQHTKQLLCESHQHQGCIFDFPYI